MPVLIFLCLLGGTAAASETFPVRGPVSSGSTVDLRGREPRLAVLKLVEGMNPSLQHGRLIPGPGLTLDQIKAWKNLDALLRGASLYRRFSRSVEGLRQDRRELDPHGLLADLSLYFMVENPAAPSLVKELSGNPLVETAYLAYQPVPPPADIPPTTPDFTAEQLYLEAAPTGFGFGEQAFWPGGDASNVAIADIEYGWDPEHEDLDSTGKAFASGWDSQQYLYHGNGVLGIMFGGDNGYGVTGAAPAAEVLVVSPYSAPSRYDVADAVDRAAQLLDAGDVLLIEQQAFQNGNYCPVEVDQAVFDAITLAVAKGIVVVEPGGNGAQDLDDPSWGGIFDRSLRDSGAIMVGGGASPSSGLDPRTWYPQGSSYGSRVDLQGWYDSITTADDGSYYPDLFFPHQDPRQAYTSAFGGTSGASPLVAAVAAIAQSVAWEIFAQPMNPMDLRSMLVSTGTPQPGDDSFIIGPQPDLRRLLRTCMAR